MKKISVIILSVVFLLFFLNYDKAEAWFNDDIMSVTVLSQDEIDELCQGKTDEILMPEVELDGGKIAYDSEQNMLLIPQNLSESKFDGVLSVPEGNLYFLEDEAWSNKAEAIEENKIFRLFWITESKCWMYNVYFTGMPVISILSGKESGEEKEFGGTISVFDQYHSNLQYQSTDCTWHLRGNSSLNYEKSSYRVTLTDKKMSFLGMRKDDDWILSSLYNDDGLIHNKVSYEVWQQIASDNSVSNDEGISMEYAELFMDNQYLGVYGLMERIDKKALSLNEKDILYKCRDQVYPGEDDFYTVLTEEMSPVFVLKYPKDFDMEDWVPLKEWTDLYCTDDPVDYEKGISVLNMENAVDYNLFCMLICGMDNEMKNIYFAAKYQNDGSYDFIKIPWDLDMTWGDSWVDDPNCFFNRYREKNITSEGGWSCDMYKLYEANPEEVSIMLNDRWNELRQDIITKENICGIIEAEYAYLYSSGAYKRNFQKWTSRVEYWSDDYIYEYVNGRIDFLDGYIEQL